MTPVPLSVLDLAPVSAGSTSRQALADTIALARAVEALGFGRFWVAEHHGMPGVASSAPAVLLGAIAAATSTIRVGSGGVMLPNHAPLVVAEIWRVVAAIRATGIATLIVDRDWRKVALHTDRLVVLQKGRVVLEGASSELADGARLAEFLGV